MRILNLTLSPAGQFGAHVLAALRHAVVRPAMDSLRTSQLDGALYGRSKTLAPNITDPLTVPGEFDAVVTDDAFLTVFVLAVEHIARLGDRTGAAARHMSDQGAPTR